MAMRIFICYRHEDSAGEALALKTLLKHLRPDFEVFMDVDSIPAGIDFVQRLTDEVQRCDVLVALIGAKWLDARDESQNRRLENSNDYVRIEISAALQRDILVIPILLNNTKMPRKDQLPLDLANLPFRSALYFRHESFPSDVGRLVDQLDPHSHDSDERKTESAKVAASKDDPAQSELFLLAPEAIVKFWKETKAFAEELAASKPVFLYYWSHGDHAIIGNACEIEFSENSGIKFSFLNPEHTERTPGAPKKRDNMFSGRLTVTGSTFTFQVYSDEFDPEPALGIGRYNVPNASDIAQGRIVGLETTDDHRKDFAFFKFILLSNPQPAADLQLTDRICVKRLSTTLAKFFEDELSRHPHICGRHPQTCD